VIAGASPRSSKPTTYRARLMTSVTASKHRSVRASSPRVTNLDSLDVPVHRYWATPILLPMVARGGRVWDRTCSLLLLLLAATSAACSGARNPAALPASTSLSREPTPELTTTGPATTVTTPSSSSASSRSPRCSTSVLSITPGRVGAALGHVGAPVLFRNTGSAPCHLQGYPGVAALDDSGRQAAQAERTPQGYLGGLAFGTSPPVVELRPGETASALVEAHNIPTLPATSCVSYPSLLVTPPDDTRSVSIALSMSGCSLQVHPVVAGDMGVLRS
jgi:hypothetical protein